MDKQIYKPRIIDHQVEEYLSAFGAVCVEGPKWCGKTWTSSYHSKSEIYMELSPALVLEGETPRLIDEWQEVPPLWDAVRYKVDQTAQKGQFILTGSATPNHKGILHSGAGRIAPPPRTTKVFSTAARDGSPDCGCAPCPCGNPGTPEARYPWSSCARGN